MCKIGIDKYKGEREMPKYRLICNNCRKFIEVVCPYEEVKNKRCNCGKKYKIQPKVMGIIYTGEKENKGKKYF